MVSMMSLKLTIAVLSLPILNSVHGVKDVFVHDVNDHIRHRSLDILMQGFDLAGHPADVNEHDHAEISVQNGLGNFEYVRVFLCAGLRGAGKDTDGVFAR